jgi:hypothetical protein
MALTKISC